ncbi:hypothetical protein JCM17478_25570 [Thermopirellula anaerolimosa]
MRGVRQVVRGGSILPKGGLSVLHLFDRRGGEDSWAGKIVTIPEPFILPTLPEVGAAHNPPSPGSY